MNRDFIYNNAPQYCHKYFDLVKSIDLAEELKNAMTLTNSMISNLKPEMADMAYSPGKWMIKQVFRHIIDCERVFAYRALRFSRFDPTPLPGFDEDEYNKHALLLNDNLSDLYHEYNEVRITTMRLYSKLTGEMLDFCGNANGAPFSARSIGFMIVGHNLHHCNVLKERYFNR